MKVLFSDNGTLFDNQIKNTIERTAAMVEKQSRLRGFVSLSFCVFTLWYIGGESVLNQNGITEDYTLQFHLPYTLSLISTIIVFFAVVIWIQRLLYVAILCIFTSLIYVASAIFDLTILLEVGLIRYITEHIEEITPIVIFLPLAYQLFVSWLYSDNYYYILGGKIMEEHVLYNKAINAQKPQDVPQEYNEAIKTTYFDKQRDSKSDTKVTNLISELNNRLQKALSVPSTFDILKYAIKNLFRVRKDVLKNYATPQINGESVNDVQQDSKIEDTTDKKGSENENHAEMEKQQGDYENKHQLQALSNDMQYSSLNKKKIYINGKKLQNRRKH